MKQDVWGFTLEIPSGRDSAAIDVVSRSQTTTSLHFYMLTSSVGPPRPMTSAYKKWREVAVWLRETTIDAPFDFQIIN